MWIRIPGNNKYASWLPGVLALVWLALVSSPVAAASPAPAPAAAPAAKEPQASEVAFIGKFACPVKRQVVLPFPGVITGIQVQPGQKVNAGDTLALYSLSPDATLAVHRRLSPPQIKDLEAKLADVERALSQADAKQREVAQLAAKKLAPPQTLAQVDKERQILARQRGAVQARLQQERQFAADDLRILKGQLGDSLNSKQMPKEGALKAPIDGYVVYTHPDLREGAELEANAIAFQIGVMDPMVVKAQVHEMESQQMAVGDQAEISPESIPGRKFAAQVSRLSWVPIKAGMEQPTYYEAEFQVPNPELTLKEGMKVRVVLRKSK